LRNKIADDTRVRWAVDRELKRGTLEMVLLQLLSEKDMYGYELTSALVERSGGSYEVKDGTLYPVLYRLEKAELVAPYWESQERGVPRKYYGITEQGRRELGRLIEEWDAFASAVSRLIAKGVRHE
jgi:PadR family transcriptional regulator, regulatory protein PadR